MKRFSKILLVFFMVSMLAFNVAFADNTTVSGQNEVSSVETQSTETTSTNNGAPIGTSGTTNINTDKIEKEIADIADKGEDLAYLIIEKISINSLPVCALLALWGAVLYFILGIRNLYKKRQGLLLMWGAFTFLVIAKIMNLVFWFILKS